MTTLKPKGRSAKQFSFKGVVMVDTVRGSLRVRRWPKKKSAATLEKMRFNMDRFRQAQQLAKYAPDVLQISARDAVKGTPLYPRDIMTMAMYGRLYAFTTPEGKVIFSMATKKGVSDSLDAIGQTEGDILIRKADIWDVLAAGQPGQVLSYVGGTDQIAWTDIASGASFGLFQGAGSSTDTSNRAGAGTELVSAVDGALKGYSFVFDAQPGMLLRPYLVELDAGSTITAILASGPQKSISFSGGTFEYLPFDQDVFLPAGKHVAFMIYNQSGGGTTSVRLRKYSQTSSPWPATLGTGGLFDIQGNVPVVGRTLGVTGSHFIGLVARIV